MNIENELRALRARPPSRIGTAVALEVGLVDGYAVFESVLGEVMVAFNPDGVSSVGLAGDEFATRFEQLYGRGVVEARPPEGWDKLIRRGIEMGTPGSLPVDYRSVTEFQRQVLEEAAQIPRGQVRPYRWLAERVGNPGATRAVGSTMARNPVPLIVPCHRVVRADGTLGKYSLGSVHNKELLLRAEGAIIGG